MHLPRLTQAALVFCAASALEAITAHPSAVYTPADIARCYGGDPVLDRNHAACYAGVAQNPGVAEVAPFAFRPLVPWLVHATGLPTMTGFALASALFLGLAAALLYDLLARDLGPRAGLIGVAVLWFSGATQSVLAYPGIVDCALVALGALTVWLCRRDRLVLACLAVALGGAVHEMAAMFIVPVVVAAWPRRGRRALLLALPAVAVYATLHWTPLLYGHVVPPYPELSLENLRHVNALSTASNGSVLGAMVYGVVYALGVGWLLLPSGWRRAPRVYRVMAGALLPTLLSCLFAADYYRMLAVAAVPLIPLVVYGLPAVVVGGQQRAKIELEPDETAAPAEAKAGEVVAAA